MGIIIHGDNLPAGSARCSSSPAPNSPIQELQPHLQPSSGIFLREKHPGNAEGGAGMGLKPPPAPLASLPVQPEPALIPWFPLALLPHADPNPTFSSLKNLSTQQERNPNIQRVGKAKFLFYPLERAPEPSLFLIDSSRINPALFPPFLLLLKQLLDKQHERKGWIHRFLLPSDGSTPFLLSAPAFSGL